MIRYKTIKANEITEEDLNNPLFPAFVKKQLVDIVNAIANDKIAISQNEWMDANKELWLNKYDHKEVRFYYDDCCDDDKLD